MLTVCSWEADRELLMERSAVGQSRGDTGEMAITVSSASASNSLTLPPSGYQLTHTGPREALGTARTGEFPKGVHKAAGMPVGTPGAMAKSRASFTAHEHSDTQMC